MKLTLLPSTVAGGPGYQFLSTTLVNDVIALDAGCLGLYHSAPEQARIRHVFLSHTHMDHLATLPIFVENAYEAKADCVTIHGSQAVLDCLQMDLFNDRIWPDFVALSRGEKPFLRLARFESGQSIEVEGVSITAVEINHVVPTVAFIIADDQCTVGFISDTGPTDAIWQRLNQEPNLRAVFLETTFPNELAWLAEVSKHLTPQLVAGELKKLSRPARIVIVHLKARFQAQVIAELKALNHASLEIGQFDMPYIF